MRNGLLHLIRVFHQIDVSNAAGESIGALFDIDVAFVVNSVVRVGIEHRISRRENRDGLSVINRGLNVTIRFHSLVVNVHRQLVATHVIIVLPCARVARVNRLTTFMMKLAALARDVNRALCFRKRRGAVGLFLAVVSRRGLAASV